MTKNVYIGKSDLGRGLFAKTYFRKGDVICILTGPVIRFEDTLRKLRAQSYPLQIGPDTYLDIGAPGCFANHSCEPNAGIRNDVELTALTAIKQKQEIRFDYSTTMDENYFVMRCRCRSSRCRKMIKDFRCLSPRLRKKYLSLGVVMNFIRSSLVGRNGKTTIHKNPDFYKAA